MLQSILSTEIFILHQLTVDEAAYLIKQAECAELALNQFIDGNISLSDYFDILELCGVNIDNCIDIFEINLQLIGA